MKKTLIKLFVWLGIGLFVFLIAILGGMILHDVIPSHGPSWPGITTGISSKEDVLNTLGPPISERNAWITTRLIYEEKGIVKGIHTIVI